MEKVGPVSFLSVMDEQLALKLAKEEDEIQLPVESSSDEELTAEQIAEIEKQFEDLASKDLIGQIPPELLNDSVHDDYALALALSQQDDEAVAADLNRKYENQKRIASRTAPNTKVYVAYDNDIPVQGDDDDDDESDEEDYVGQRENAKPKGRQSKRNYQTTKHDPEISGKKNRERLQKFVNSEIPDKTLISNPVFNSLKSHSQRDESRRVDYKGGKEDRSTHEQVLDPRTRIMLLKLLNTNFLKEMHGSVSTGKEANVYHGIRGDFVGSEDGITISRFEESKGSECAIKIFRTTLNEFKDRAKYLQGDSRFRRANVKTTNARKLIKFWADKEFRNLYRIHSCGLPCPMPIHQVEGILVMSFIGENGTPAPQLKDVDVSHEKFVTIYRDCITLMRRLYQECRLVHGDLSEYNLLYFQSHLWLIDVSQSIEYDHNEAANSLRKDCKNITKFFERRGLPVLTIYNLFKFISEASIENVDQYLINVWRTQDIPLTEEEKEEQFLFFNKDIPPSPRHKMPFDEEESSIAVLDQIK